MSNTALPPSDSDQPIQSSDANKVQTPYQSQATQIIDTSAQNPTSTAHAIKMCIKCGAHMTLLTTVDERAIGQQSWSCSAFPQCQHTETI